MFLINNQSTILYDNQTNLELLEEENQPPIANDDSGSLFEDEIFYGNVLSNDSDPDGNPITITAVNGNSDAVGVAIILPSGAIVVLYVDGSYFYDPNGQFDTLNDGETASDSFEYTISDSTGEETTVSGLAEGRINAGAFVSHTINGKTTTLTSTQPPIVVNDTSTIRKDGFLSSNVLQNDSNPEGGSLGVTAVNGNENLVDQEFITPLGAKIEINRSGRFSYAPLGRFNNLLEGQTATETFTYTAVNNGGLTATATVTVIIQGFNDVPAGFDAAQYGASNPDLIPIYRNDLAGLTTHYLQHGRAENRPLDNFDEFRYVASSYAGHNGDLITAFGLNGAAATLHYLTNGFFEGRSKTAFDPARYLDSHDDLRNALGTNTQAATQHFITNGFNERRDPNLFLSDRYIASYGDLINTYHYDLEAGSLHYLVSGRNEGRRITFDPIAYMTRNPDVATAYNNDPTQATFHYITHGFSEGRPPA